MKAQIGQCFRIGSQRCGSGVQSFRGQAQIAMLHEAGYFIGFTAYIATPGAYRSLDVVRQQAANTMAVGGGANCCPGRSGIVVAKIVAKPGLPLAV